MVCDIADQPAYRVGSASPAAAKPSRRRRQSRRCHRAAGVIGLIAGHREAVIDPSAEPAATIWALVNWIRGMNGEGAALHAGLGRQVGQMLERRDVLRPAVGITG